MYLRVVKFWLIYDLILGKHYHFTKYLNNCHKKKSWGPDLVAPKADKRDAEIDIKTNQSADNKKTGSKY